jgi:hypothetical protein
MEKSKFQRIWAMQQIDTQASFNLVDLVETITTPFQRLHLKL